MKYIFTKTLLATALALPAITFAYPGVMVLPNIPTPKIKPTATWIV